eukprot:9588420-Alexandrium_andersonii.AAC.1
MAPVGVAHGSSGAAVFHGSVPVTAEGGRYCLCWCAAGFSCVDWEEFRVDAGCPGARWPLVARSQPGRDAVGGLRA